MNDWRQVLGLKYDSLKASHYRMSEDEHNCATCSNFAPFHDRGVVAGTCGKHNVTVAPKGICDDYRLHDESPRYV